MPRKRHSFSWKFEDVPSAPEEPVEDAQPPQEAFPIPAKDHGKEMLSIHVGPPEARKVFTLHKSLLFNASPRSASLGNFQEGRDNRVDLKTECPMAFEVFYQYLYSGKVLPAQFYTRNNIDDDLHWFRTLKFADYMMMNDLARTAYKRLRELFNNQACKIPGLDFLGELYSQQEPLEKIQEYIVAHAAYWICSEDSVDWESWKSVLEGQTEFAVAVAIQLTKLHSDAFDGCKEHPTRDDAFDDHVVLPSTTPSRKLDNGAAPEEPVPDDEPVPELDLPG